MGIRRSRPWSAITQGYPWAEWGTLWVQSSALDNLGRVAAAYIGGMGRPWELGKLSHVPRNPMLPTLVATQLLIYYSSIHVLLLCYNSTSII